MSLVPIHVSQGVHMSNQNRVSKNSIMGIFSFRGTSSVFGQNNLSIKGQTHSLAVLGVTHYK